MTPKRVNVLLKASLIALVVITSAGLYLANQKLVNVANTTSRLHSEIELSQKQVEAYNLTKIKVESLGYVDELANKVLPASSEQSVVVAELSQFAARSKLSVAQISFPDSTGPKPQSSAGIPKGVTSVPISIQFKDGTKYENILEFLRYVEKNQRKMQVVDIDLKPNDEDRSQLSSVTIVLNLYVKSVSAAEKKQ
jgi:Tfp pilus assembly protein PilO